MLGFVVDKMDIHKNTCGNVNGLMSQTMTNDKGIEVNANVTKPLTNIIIENTFYYSYISKHKHENENRAIVIYHMMFDFSDLVQKLQGR